MEILVPMNLIQNILNWFWPAPPNPGPVVIPPSTNWMNNLLRLHNGLRPSNYSLRLNSQLVKGAQDYANFMAAHPNELSHTENGTEIDRANKAGYNSVYIGENIAEGAVTESDVFNLWRNSPAHYANMVNANYKDVGFGLASSSDGRKFWCALFGRIW